MVSIIILYATVKRKWRNTIEKLEQYNTETGTMTHRKFCPSVTRVMSYVYIIGGVVATQECSKVGHIHISIVVKVTEPAEHESGRIHISVQNPQIHKIRKIQLGTHVRILYTCSPTTHL